MKSPIGLDTGRETHYFLNPMSWLIQVELGDRSYPIHVLEAGLDGLGVLCASIPNVSACLVVTDENVGARYAARCVAALQAAGFRTALTTVPAGEPTKALDHLGRLYDAAVTEGLDRRSLVVALGGGVVGDLAGFLAATYLRGLRFLQVPTSLLAMVDSAVGGKTGINLPQGKNLVGAFHQPSLVLADLATLQTLPPREFAAGLAEVVKYGMIRDAELFDRLAALGSALLEPGHPALGGIVARCVEIKAEVVRADEREGGLRAILNYGHTLGHAIENVAGYGQFLHGEAVAIGMVFAARLSERVTDFPAGDTRRLATLLTAFNLPVEAAGLSFEALYAAMTRDKKAADRQPHFVLSEAVGRVRHGCAVSRELLEEVWHVGG